MKTSLLRRLLCLARLHDWKRAKRAYGNEGMQGCRFCSAERVVRLRPRKQPMRAEEAR